MVIKMKFNFLLLDPTHLTFNPAQIKKGFTQITYQWMLYKISYICEWTHAKCISHVILQKQESYVSDFLHLMWIIITCADIIRVDHMWDV